MKSFRKSIVKKICIYLLCTFILSTSVFMSYGNTLSVYADDYDSLDMIRYWIYIAQVFGGIASIPFTGGLSLAGGLVAADGVLGVISGYDDYKNYILDNGDGTYTMTPEFINIVLNETKKIEESGFHDYDSISNGGGMYTVAGYAYWSDWSGLPNAYKYSGTFKEKPFGIGDSRTVYFKVYKGDHKISSLYIGYEFYRGGEFRSSSSSNSAGNDSSPPNTLTFNFPIFPNGMSENDIYAAFDNNDFSGALNYREKMFEYGSIYAPVYTGGSVTFRKEVLDGLEDKIKEVDKKYDKVDDKINALTEYIYNYGNSGGNGNTGGGFDFDFDIDSPFDLGDLFNGLFKDWEGFGSSFITSLADFFSDIANGLKKKFPFSIPWDVYHIFTVFSNVTSPEPANISTMSFTDHGGIQIYTVDQEDLEQDVHDAPYFKLPIKVKSFGIYEEIIVDMKDFKTLSTFSRTMFSLLFAVFLLKFTLKILSIFGVFGGGD